MPKGSTSKICLIVSGDPLLRRKLCLTAEKYGFEALEAAGADSAQKCIAKHRLDVVVFGEGVRRPFSAVRQVKRHSNWERTGQWERIQSFSTQRLPIA